MNDTNNITQIINQYKGFLDMPSIIGGNHFKAIENYTTRNIKTPAFDLTELESIQKHIYVGKRAEYFMLHYLKQQVHISNVMHSIQIQDDTNTLGELDFLFFNESIQKWIHLELVTKFYIYNSDDEIENYIHWIGPNLKDRLEYKLDKLKNHQLQLFKRPEARAKLEELNIDVNYIETQLCFKAKLFLPQNLVNFQHRITSPNSICGTYISLDLLKQLQFEQFLYHVPKKIDWLSSPELQTHWYSFDKAINLIKQSLKEKRSCLLWRKNYNDEYFENFVVWWN